MNVETSSVLDRLVLPAGILVAFALALASGCDWRVPAGPPPRPVPVEDIVDFTTLYNLHCAGCHGADGKLGPAPPLNDAIFLAIVPDTELQRVIAEGRRGTLMPAWSHEQGGPLSDAQLKVLVGGIKTQERWDRPAKIEGEIPPYTSDTVAKTGNHDAGARVFASACADCHGENGQGGKKAGAVRDTAFLALLSDQAVRRLVITGRPDLGMPGYGPAAGRRETFTPLTSADVSDVVALLAYWRDHNTGK